MSFQVGVDTGGTFTDLVALSDEGSSFVHKVPSNAADPAAALIAGLGGIAERVGVGLESFLANCDLIVHGTTVALNALIQRRGARTALLSTEGHEDSLEIRLGHKEDGHRWDFSYPPVDPIVPAARRVGVCERVLADGSVHTPLDEDSLRERLAALREDGVESVAVSLLWSFLHPEHERRVASVVREEMPGCFVTTSSEVLPRVREYTRASTTAANAYVGPVLVAYMRDIDDTLAAHGYPGDVYYMQSSGGVGSREVLERKPVAALNSGPAGGPIAALSFGDAIGTNDVIAIDMGGTSFETCLVKDGLPDVAADIDLVRQRIGLPMVNVTTIGAGGGSIAAVDEMGVLRVGPESAEARPGPACYGLGGTEPTVTDALVVLGWLPPDALLGGAMPIDRSLAEQAIRRGVADPLGLDAPQAAQGILEVAAHNMADGIRAASVERGHDPRDFVMVAGGGAGPLFAARLAAELSIRTTVIPRAAGTLCAFGQAIADLRHDSVRSYPASLAGIDTTRLAALCDEMAEEGRSALGDAIEDGAEVRLQRTAEMKYADQIHYCDVAMPEGPIEGEVVADLAERFHTRHEQLYGYAEPDNEVELLSVRLSVSVRRQGIGEVLAAVGADPRGEDAAREAPAEDLTGAGPRRPVLLPGREEPVSVPVHNGRGLGPGTTIDGPAVVEEETTTIAVLPGCSLRLDERGFYVLRVDGR